MLKFKKPSAKLQTFAVDKAKSLDQGLRTKTVKLKGNSNGPTKKVPAKSLPKQFLGKRKFLEKLAADDVHSVVSSASSVVSSVASSVTSTVASSVTSSVASSVSSGRYSGSFASSGASIPPDKSFDILREQRKSNPFGLTNDELEEAEKQDILGRLHSLRMKGSTLSKNFTLRSSLAELRLEMGRLEREHEAKRAVQRMRRWLLAAASGLQYITSTKYAPLFIRGKFDGFSAYVLSSIEDYDAVFEQISQKYGALLGSTGKPLLDLGLLLASQVLLFLFMQSKAGTKPPSAEEIQENYPELVKRAQAEAAEKEAARIAERNDEKAAQFARQMAQTQMQMQMAAAQAHMEQQRRSMRFPSFTVPLVSAAYVAPFVEESVYDLVEPPAQVNLEEIHQNTTPQIEEVPLTPEHDDENELPNVPSERTKHIPMPDRPSATRKPKEKKTAAQQVPQEEKKTLEI